MKPENIQKLIKKWKKDLAVAKEQLKRFAKEECYLTAAVIDAESDTLSQCLRELESAIKPKTKDK